MQELTIRLFGAPEVTLRGSSPLRFPSEKTLQLLCYLVLFRGKAHSRAVLAGHFWGDYPEAYAQKSLRTALWRLRSILEPDGTPRGRFLVLERGSVRFNTASPYWLDVEEFEAVVAGPRLGEDAGGAEVVQAFERVAGLYRGDLMEGHYAYWALQEQDRLKMVFVQHLEQLIGHYTRTAEYSQARMYAHRALAIDPSLETVHRSLMLLAYLSGDRPAALRQYRMCSNILRRMFGITPMEETTSLYSRIQTGSVDRAEAMR